MKSFALRSTALFALLAPLAAQGSILPYLPKDTMVAMAAPNLSMSIAEFAKMPLAKMWAEEEVQTFLADVKELVTKQIADGMAQAKEMHAQGALPVNPDDIMKLRVEGGSFALTKLGMSMGGRRPQPTFGLVIHLEFGDSAPTWNALLKMGLGMMEAEAGDEMTKLESKIGDVTVISYSPPAEAGTEMGLHLAMVPNGLLIGTLASDVQEIVAAMNGKSPMLGATSLYQATRKHLNTDGAECEMFVRPGPMIDFAMSLVRMGIEQGGVEGVDVDGISRAVEAMGLRNLGAAGMTSSYVDGKCVSRTFTTNGAETTTAAVTTLDTTFLKWVPKDAVGFSSGTLNVMSIYDTLVRGLEAYDAKFATQVMEQLTKIEGQLGFNIRNDFFGAIGDHYISWSMPMGTIASPPEVAILVKVTDETKLVNVIKNLAKLSNGMVEIEEGEKRGVKAYQLQIHFDPTQGMGGVNPFDMFQPTFAFKGGYMVMGFTASDVKRVFQRMDREDDPKGDIRSNKEFAAIAASIPAGVDSLSFTDWKSNFESLYQVATGLLAFVPMGDQVPIDMSLLPDSATLTKHLFGSLGYSKTTAAGTEMVSVSPFGPELGLLAVAAIAAGVGVVGSMRGF